MTENVRYLDHARYDELIGDARRASERTERSCFPHREVAESVLYHEARLLDTGRYEDWLELLSDDCMYWVPAEVDSGDPRVEASVNFDDRRRLMDRVALIRTGYLHAQTPPSRTCRIIGNIETWQSSDATLDVRSALTLWMFRHGITTAFVGSQQHQLVLIEGDWRIRKKVVQLLDRDQPLGNISFIL